ncbi:MAG: IS110 family transposase [Deltaproteobacteria bacterium]|nr:IS110 family transposase [Deltaproteobacteria bacterium]
MEHLYLGVDISKDRSSAHGIDESGKVWFSLFFDMDSTGFALLIKTIYQSCADTSRVVVAMESTACYQINLYSYLNAQGLQAIIVNPLLIANFTKLSLRKTKTDKKDAETIAWFLSVHQESITQINLSQNHQEIRDLARERDSLCNQISAVRVEIRRLLQTTFPELERLCNHSSKTMVHFMRRYPSAWSVRTARPTSVAKTLKQSRCSEKLTFSDEEIIERAKRSVASISPVKALILRGKLETLAHLEQRKKCISKVLTEYCEASILNDLEILTSIDGINKGTATTFLAETGGVERFASHRSLCRPGPYGVPVRQV